MFALFVGTKEETKSATVAGNINSKVARQKNLWPQAWKQETMVIIPKCSNPTSYSELRNLSCTPLFSKILESFVLDELKSELAIDPTQYGSTKNCGAEHYLIEAWDHVLTSLEDNAAAVNLISIDFSKAFNSLDHSKCLEMFQKKGASTQSLGMLYAFLQERKMTVRIDNHFSTSLQINGGSPQGTLLGNLIFVIATSDLDKNLTYNPYPNVSNLNTSFEPIIRNNETLPSDDSDESPVKYFRRSIHSARIDSSSEEEDEEERANRSIHEHITLREEIVPEDWEYTKPIVVKYVDDILGSEKLYLPTGKTHLSTDKQISVLYAKQSEELINRITINAAVLGLKVNAKKTQMTCISTSTVVKPSSFILNTLDSGERNSSSESIKAKASLATKERTRQQLFL